MGTPRTDAARADERRDESGLHLLLRLDERDASCALRGFHLITGQVYHAEERATSKPVYVPMDGSPPWTSKAA